LVAMAYSHSKDAHQYRVVCDCVNLLLIFDDLVDEMSATGSPRDRRNITRSFMVCCSNWACYEVVLNILFQELGNLEAAVEG
jgi:hypothetical protein